MRLALTEVIHRPGASISFSECVDLSDLQYGTSYPVSEPVYASGTVRNTADVLMENMRQGDVILFHTTAQDLAILQELVPRLHADGWQMVTLNELFDLSANEQTPFTEQNEPLPLEEYTRMDQTYKKGDFLHDVLLMQYRLTSLGYLNDKCDGCFGANTENAVRTFQRDAGLSVTGQCDPATWEALFAP